MKHGLKLLAAALLATGAPQAFAADNTPVGTASGTVIENQATVTYTVGTTPQTAVVNDPKANFTVDRKIDLAVAKVGGTVPVAPKESPAIMKFTVTNESNATLDFHLTAANGSGFGPLVAGTYRIYVDKDGKDGDGNYVAADDTDSNYIDDLESGDSVTVFLAVDIPDSDVVANGDTSEWTVTAKALESNGPGVIGAEITADDAGSADNEDAVDDVFAEGDATKDGAIGDTNTFTVASTTITVDKYSFVLWDPVNLYANPKAIPGAKVVYCIEVRNTGGQSASAVSIKDPIPGGTTYSPNSIRIHNAHLDCTADALTDGSGTFDQGTAVTDAADSPADEGDSGGGTEIHTTIPTIAATSGVAMTIFTVEVN